MIRRPPRSTRTDTLFPYTTLFRSNEALFIIQSGRGFRLFEIAGNGHLRLHPKFAAGIRLVRREIAEFRDVDQLVIDYRSDEHTSELQSLMRIPVAGF